MSRNNPPHVLFVGEPPRKSAPTLTAAQALHDRCGFTFSFADGIEFRNTRAWLKLVRASDAVISVAFDGPNWFRVRQWSLAAALGKPMIRWWVGSDVMTALESPLIGREAVQLQRVMSAQVAVAPHLVDELRSIGVEAVFIPMLLDPGPQPQVDPDWKNALLVYLPTRRREFYGEPILREVIPRHRDTRFLVVADESHSLADYPNVTSIGWTDDMAPLWSQVGGVLRITQHDGMPRMALDALRRGKHVIYSWPFPGCRQAVTADEVSAAISEFSTRREINHGGPAVFDQVFTPTPEDRLAELIMNLKRQFRVRRQAIALASALITTIRIRRYEQRRAAQQQRRTSE